MEVIGDLRKGGKKGLYEGGRNAGMNKKGNGGGKENKRGYSRFRAGDGRG